MKRFIFAFVAVVTVLITLSATTQAQTTVDQWGFLGGRQGNWVFTPGSAPGGGGIGGTASLSVEWGAIRGGFTAPVTATTSQAILVTGNIEFEGAGIDTWSGLRYGLFMHDSVGTLITTNVDSTRWSGSESYSHGYMFTPVSGTNRVTDGVSGGVGTNWVRISGNYISTSSGSGPIYLASSNLQKPARAVADAGKYAFAFSVQPLANGTKEVRFYLIKGDAANSATSTYYFGGSYIDTSSIAPTFNGVCFAVHATGSGPNPNLRGVKLTDVKVDLGTPFELPEAPWAAYYVDRWGFLGGRQGNWSFIPGDLIGNGGIEVDATSSVEWAAIRGGFVEPVTATTDKAILVTGNIEFEGAGIDTWSGLRYGLFMHDSAGTIITKVDTVAGRIIDSTRWSGSESYSHGYMFTPVSGTNRVTDGVSGGVGTNWVRISGNYISTSSGSGPIYLASSNLQKPVRAVADAGKYAFAFSVQPLADGTKEVRFYLIKGDAAGSATSTYYFGGSYIDTSSIAPTFNGVCFAAHAGGSGPNPDLRGVKLTDVKVDLGTPFDLPEAPWANYYVEINDWGVIGNRTGGWKFIPGEVIGNAGIGSSTPNTGWAAIRGFLGAPLTPPLGKTLRIVGKIQFTGGGFEGNNALRFGMFYSDSAGTVQNAGTDTAAWSGSEDHHSGYLFMPRSGTNVIPDWASGGSGTWGTVVNSVWRSYNQPNNYVLGSEVQAPGDAVATSGTYNFKMELQVQNDGSNLVGFSLTKDDNSYAVIAATRDAQSPIATNKINCVAFALDSWSGSTTTAMNLLDVEVQQTTTFETPVEFSSFAASVSGLEVTLNWSTATETNNYGYEVQRKVDGGSFATVAFIKGQGTTTQKSEYSFIDKNLEAGKYSYRIKQVDYNGQFDYSNTIEVEVHPLYKFALEQNYPNPFNPTTTINYTLIEKSKTKLVLLNALGQEVAVLVNEEQDKGYYKITVDGSNLASGVYFYKLIAKDNVSVKKMILIK